MQLAAQPVGIFGLGEMGSSVARLLSSQGVHVVSYLEERSESTRQRARESGVESLPTARDVVERSELILSITISSQVENVAKQVAREMPHVANTPLFVDCNAISPKLSKHLAEIIKKSGGRMVDASIVGLAKDVGKGARLYVSGAEAERLLSLQDYGLRVEIVGPNIGQASGQKMLYAAQTKGISALTTEILMTARGLGLEERIMQTYREVHPELAQLIERLIPSLPFRAARRAEEMQELEATMRDTGFQPHTPQAAAGVLGWIGALHLEKKYTKEDEESWTWKDVIDILRERT